MLEVQDESDEDTRRVALHATDMLQAAFARLSTKLIHVILFGDANAKPTYPRHGQAAASEERGAPFRLGDDGTYFPCSLEELQQGEQENHVFQLRGRSVF